MEKWIDPESFADVVMSDFAFFVASQLDNPEGLKVLRSLIRSVPRRYIAENLVSLGLTVHLQLAEALTSVITRPGQPSPEVVGAGKTLPELAIFIEHLSSAGGVFSAYACRILGNHNIGPTSTSQNAAGCSAVLETWYSEIEIRKDELRVAALRPRNPVNLSLAEEGLSCREDANDAKIENACEAVRRIVEAVGSEFLVELNSWKSRTTAPTKRFANDIKAEIKNAVEPLFRKAVGKMITAARESGAEYGQGGQDEPFRMDRRFTTTLWEDWDKKRSKTAKDSMSKALTSSTAKRRLEVVLTEVVGHFSGVINRAEDKIVGEFRRQLSAYISSPTSSSFIQRRYAAVLQEEKLVKELRNRQEIIADSSREAIIENASQIAKSR